MLQHAWRYDCNLTFSVKPVLLNFVDLSKWRPNINIFVLYIWVCLFYLVPGGGRAEAGSFIVRKPLVFSGMKQDWFWGMKRKLCKCVSILLLSMGRCRCVTEVWNGMKRVRNGKREPMKNINVSYLSEALQTKQYLWNGSCFIAMKRAFTRRHLATN